MSDEAAPPNDPTPGPALSADEASLAELGYKQELKRGMSGFGNFAVSFSIISILAGCITSYSIALGSDGPAAITIGWPLVGVWMMALSSSWMRY